MRCKVKASTNLLPLAWYILSLTACVFSQCLPKEPCFSCQFFSVQRNLVDCSTYHFCHYGELWATLRCGRNQIYSLHQHMCVSRHHTDECIGATPVVRQRGSSLPPILQSSRWRNPTNVPMQSRRPPPGDKGGRTPDVVTTQRITSTTAVLSEPTNNGFHEKFPAHDKCGIKVSSYIVGGERADRAEWAWQISLQAYDVINRHFVHVCGGTLIHESWVVTAAHCVHGSKPDANLIAVAGQYRLHSKDPWRQISGIDKILMHPRYRHFRNYPNDIALLRLSAPFNLTTAVRPVCLPHKPSRPDIDSLSSPRTDRFRRPLNYNHTNCWTTGWGKSKGNNPDVLREVNVRFVPLWRCKNIWPGYVRPFHVCAVSNDGTACKGDSGGPLVCVDRGRYFLHGVVSWGEGTCDVTNMMPNVFTRVGAYLAWITDTMDAFAYNQV